MTKIIGIDLFSGAGGLSLGAMMAGVDIRIAIESDPYAAQTYARNHPSTLVLNQRVEDVSVFDLKRSSGDRLVVIGGPPCQGFSTSNQRTRTADNPKNWLFQHYLKVVGILRPDWVVFENVTGIETTMGGTFLQATAEGFRNIGYSVEQLILNAKDFGVPQKRSRLFLIASLHGERVNTPLTTNRMITVGEALFDLPELPNGNLENELRYKCSASSAYARRLRGRAHISTNHLVTRNAPHILERFMHVPQGGNWSRHTRSVDDKLPRCRSLPYWHLPSAAVGPTCCCDRQLPKEHAHSSNRTQRSFR